MPNMRGFAFLGCRLLSLLLLYWALQTTRVSVSAVLQFLNAELSLGSDTTVHIVFWPLFFTALELALVLVLWFGAERISAHLTQDAPPAAEGEDWSRSGVLSMAVAVIGLFFLVSLVPQVAQSFYLIAFQGLTDSASVIPFLAHVVLTLGVGLGCLLGRHGIADFIVKARGR